MDDEQARERVAFEVTLAEWKAAEMKSGNVGQPITLTDVNAELARRPAPSAQPSFNIGNQHVFFLEGEWRALDSEAGSGDEGYYASGELQSVVDEALEAELSRRLVDQRPAPSAQPWTLPDRDQIEAKLEGCRFLSDEVDVVLHFLKQATAPVASAQPRMHSEECDEHLMQLERDLAAERAAHQATKAGLDEAIARADRLEAKASQLTDMLHAERAAHEATREERQTWYDNAVQERVRRVAAEKRAAELERELAEARAKLEALRGACRFQGGEPDIMPYWEETALGAHNACARAYIRRIQSALAQESAKPAEPAKPATPDLDLAGRVSRVEKAALVFLAAAARQTTSTQIAYAASDALKALEGGGSNG